MGLMGQIEAITTGSQRAIEVADQLRRGIEAQGTPPGVERLAPRPRGAYDRLMDALNRLPRPIMVLGSLALLGAALVAPGWFEARMDALARMPEGLWWVIGAVVSLHWGARFQAYAQNFERDVVERAAQAVEKSKGPVSEP